MAKKLFISLFTFIVLLSSLGNGWTNFAFESEAEVEALESISTKLNKDKQLIPLIWSVTGKSHTEVRIKKPTLKIISTATEFISTSENFQIHYYQPSALGKIGPPYA